MHRILVGDVNHELSTWVDSVCAQLQAVRSTVRSGDALESELLRNGPYDLVLASARLPALSALQVLARARAVGIGVPFIVITSSHGQLVRVMVSDGTSETLSSRMVDANNLAALARTLVRLSTYPPHLPGQ